ncbi:MAG TPA: phosphopantothenoylcysteine decarboxylase [Urbifossiella sp.]|jgi:phosphopantothenoylcysteine synthetase/decarboxylase
MNLLVTAGNTQAPIDRVRCITNIFSGRTGAAIALAAWSRGHTVSLATSHPDTLFELGIDPKNPGERFTLLTYRTFDELATLLQTQLRGVPFDAICHSAAVSDYLPAGTFSPNAGTYFNARISEWEGRAGTPSMTEQKAGKIKSTEPELWVRLVRAPKLIDRFRSPWGFEGILVKFKLEVGLSEEELLELAEHSRNLSTADLIVANTLDGAKHWAFLGPIGEGYERLPRAELPERLIAAIEELLQEQAHHG